VEKIEAKSTKHYDKLIESKKNIHQSEQKPLYKLKMFTGVGSKVIENLKKFKTCDDNYKLNDQPKNNLDFIIEKIENELKHLEGNENVDKEDNENANMQNQ